MSRPKAWNGTQWVDPSFWTGSAWKTYIPPVYDQPLQWTFPSNVQGWDTGVVPGGGWNSGGFITSNGENTFMGDGCSCAYTNKPALQVQAHSGHTIQFKCSMRLRKLNAAATDPDEVEIDARLNAYDYSQDKYIGWKKDDTKANYALDNAWKEITITLTKEPGTLKDGQFLTPYVSIAMYTMALGGDGTITAAMDIDNAQFYCATEGVVVKSLGNPGWEPKVKRSDGSWK